jgi:hypothetical protein
MYNHELTHGAFLLDYEVKQAIVTEMRGLLARSGSAVVGLARPVLARTLTLMTNGFGGSPGRVSMKKGGGNGRCVVYTSIASRLADYAHKPPVSARVTIRDVNPKATQHAVSVLRWCLSFPA